MAILDPELNALIALKSYADKNTAESDRDNPVYDFSKPIHISVEFKGDIAELKTLGFETGKEVTGNIAYGHVFIEGLISLARHANVISIEKERNSETGLNDSVPDIKADQVWTRSGNNFTGYTGEDVIVGIIDTGIDFKHHSFRDAGENTRILKIWDQTLDAADQAGEAAPAAVNINGVGNVPLGYGVEYNTAQINNNLTDDSPSLVVRHKDKDGHGTHVAGIAAGDGSQSGRCHGEYTYIGVAPRADIIAVRLYGLTEGDEDRPSASSNGLTMDAIYYILNEAKSFNPPRPVVINCSYGRVGDLIGGTSHTSRKLDEVLTNNSDGFAIVFIAHNYAHRQFRAEGNIPSGDTFDLRFRIFPDDTKTRSFSVRYSGTDLEARVTSPIDLDDKTTDWSKHGESTVVDPDINGPGGSVSVSNFTDRVQVTITPKNSPEQGNNESGEWELELKNTGSAAVDFEAFSLDSGNSRISPYFLNAFTNQSTITQQASTNEVITVGSYEVGGQLAESSGRGPTRDGRTKPEITAPGVGISSAGVSGDRSEFEDYILCKACCCDCCQDFYVIKGGTSMAAPHVAGMIALMFQKDNTLTHTEVKTLITTHKRNKPADAPSEDDTGWGAGRIDAKAATDAITQVNPPSSSPTPSEPVTMIATPDDHFKQLQERFLGTGRGPEFFRLFKKHFDEIRTLVNTNKRVATVWHRHKGPQWIRAGMKSLSAPELAIPFEIEGISILSGLKRMAEILKRYGSEMLVEDIMHYEMELNSIQKGMDLNDLIEVLGNFKPVHKTSLA